MADIVYLNAAATLPRDVLASELTESCEIILFPGVRYERWEEPAQPQPVAQLKPVAPRTKKRAKKRELEPAD